MGGGVGRGQDKAGGVFREGVFVCDGQKRAGERGKFHSRVDGMVGGRGKDNEGRLPPFNEKCSLVSNKCQSEQG